MKKADIKMSGYAISALILDILLLLILFFKVLKPLMAFFFG